MSENASHGRICTTANDGSVTTKDKFPPGPVTPECILQHWCCVAPVWLPDPHHCDSLIADNSSGEVEDEKDRQDPEDQVEDHGQIFEQNHFRASAELFTVDQIKIAKDTEEDEGDGEQEVSGSEFGDDGFRDCVECVCHESRGGNDGDHLVDEIW